MTHPRTEYRRPGEGTEAYLRRIGARWDGVRWSVAHLVKKERSK